MPTVLRFLPLIALAACVEPADLDSDELEIDGQRQLASDYFTARAVNQNGCSGTIIGPRHVLTALHCNPYKNPRVEVYPAGHPEAADSTNPFDVIAWYLPGGTYYRWDAADQEYEYDWTDTDGDLADLMILEVDRNFSRFLLGSPPNHPAATLAWAYPGDDVYGIRVGAGNHDGDSNPDGVLYMNIDSTYSSDDSGGDFILDDNHVNPGDSGGPFYVDKRIVGTLTSFWGLQTRYTSVPRHLSWILAVIQYRWPGQAPFAGMVTGTLSSTFYNSESACQYACQHTTGCAGYNHFKGVGQCQLFSSVTGTIPGGTLFRAARR